MLKKTVEWQGATLVVRTANRMTPIIEGHYMRILEKRQPELKSYQVPKMPKSMLTLLAGGQTDAAQTDVDPEVVNYLIELSKDKFGHELYEAAHRFVPIAARITSVSGLAFVVASDERMSESDLSMAWNDFLKGESVEDDLWVILANAINELDAPLTPAHEHKPESELTDPNSLSSVEDGSRSFTKTPSATPVGG